VCVILATIRELQFAKYNLSTDFLVFFRYLNCSRLERFINYCYPTTLLQTFNYSLSVLLSLIIFSLPNFYLISEISIYIQSSIMQCYIPLKK